MIRAAWAAQRRPVLFLLTMVGVSMAGSLRAEQPGTEAAELSPLAPLEESTREHKPLVIAHRGASGYRPEHTLAAYRLAIRQGADFIEPDLVLTRDGVLVARHENELSDTTDVAQHPEFAARKVTKQISGRAVTGWFSEDFTLAELKTLRAKERIPDIRPDNRHFDGRLEIPTLDEVLDLVERVERTTGRRIGIYPETKLPTYFEHEGRYLDLASGKPGEPIHRSISELLVETLVRRRFTDPGRVYIQSFEVANLLELKQRIMPRHGVDFPLIQLYGSLATGESGAAGPHPPYDVRYHNRRVNGRPEGLREIYGDLVERVPGGMTVRTGYGQLATPQALRCLRETYAAGIGPSTGSLLPRVAFVRPPQEPAGEKAAGEQASSKNASGKKAAVGRQDREGPRTQWTGETHPLLAAARAAGLEVHPYTLRADPEYRMRGPNGQPLTVQDEVRLLLDRGATGFFIDHPQPGVEARDAWLREQSQGDRSTSVDERAGEASAKAAAAPAGEVQPAVGK